MEEQNKIRKSLLQQIVHISDLTFSDKAVQLYRYQYQYNPFYRQYCNLLRKGTEVSEVTEIPFLPIDFFKTEIISCLQDVPQFYFASSGTTVGTRSKHFLHDLVLYENTFLDIFQESYGSPSQFCIMGLLPSYQEQQHSSLVYMVQHLIQATSEAGSGFYLNDDAGLWRQMQANEAKGIHTILFGVTYALLDFAAAHPMKLKHTIVIETGGMKGRKKEMTRAEVHDELKQNWSLQNIHSEYGMTELLSQAYSTGNGIFTPNNYLQILLRAEDDPLCVTEGAQLQQKRRGVVNIIDLANIDSCAFIATDDAGILHPSGNFEITGRVDSSEARGCSLMLIQ